jgi:hypothetical protein
VGYSFNGTTKIISLTAGTTVLDVRDMYSRWKDWVASDGARFLYAFEVVGGDPIDVSAGVYVTGYFFLANGWRVRPQEANHRLQVVNGVLLTKEGADPFLSVLGNYNVLVLYSQPIRTETVSTGGGGATPAQIADAVWDEPVVDHSINGTTGKALSTASSGGVDLGALSDAVWTRSIRAVTDKAGFEIAGTKTRLDDLNDLSVTDLESPYVNYAVDPTYNVTGYNLIQGTLISGNADDTKSIGTPTVFAPTAVAPLEVVFAFELGSSRPSELIFKGYYTGSGGAPTSRYVDVAAYSFVDTSWQVLSDAGNRIPSGTVNVDRTYVLQQNHVSATGQVLIRYTSSRANASDRFYLDLHLVSAVNAGITASELAEAVWTHDVRNRALDGTHTSSGFFLSRTVPEWGNVISITGNEVTVSGDLFNEDAVGLYSGRTIQFHQRNELIYEVRKVVDHKAGGVLELDKAPVIVNLTNQWHCYLLPELNINNSDISNAVWDEPVLDHTVEGSTGKALGAASSGGVDYETLSEAVWGALLSVNVLPGSFGWFIQKKLLTVAKFIGLK